LENGMSATRLRDGLLQCRLIIRDCSNFEGLDHRFFRVAVRTGEENRRLLAALGEALSEKAG
jgi:threonine-phosphate decarboxylase